MFSSSHLVINVNSKFVTLFMMFCIVMLGFGCGGNSCSVSVTDSGITYDGRSTQALIDDTNAVEISTGSISDGLTGATASDLKTLSAEAPAAQKQFAALKISRILAAASWKATIEENSKQLEGMVTPTAVKSGRNTQLGTCGGSATTNITVDDQTGEFTGSIYFNDLCDEDILLDGDVDIEGKIDLVTLEPVNLNMAFKILSCSYENESVAMNGEIGISMDGDNSDLSMDFYVKDNTNNKVFHIEDYLFEVTEHDTYIEVTVTGTYYNPDFGYVVLQTESPMKLDINKLYPYEGVIVATGKIGTAGGPTKGSITFIDEDSFIVKADTTGNGVYDWDSGVLYWNGM
jgi:hypothetical protein